MLDGEARSFLERCRVGHLATADASACPHVIPVCFVLEAETLYITVDEKPKRAARRPLKRVRNLLENPRAAFVADVYSEDWSRLGWVMVGGPAEVLETGAEHDRAQARLRKRYSQLRAMRIEGLPVIALRIERARSWGRLEA